VKACGGKYIGPLGKADLFGKKGLNNIIGFCATCPAGMTPLIAGAHLDPTPPVSSFYTKNPDVSLLTPGEKAGSSGVGDVANECGGCSGPDSYLFIANVRTTLALSQSSFNQQKGKYSLVYECHACKNK
jgi:hypothetical protein